MGEGGVKYQEKLPMSFMDGPLYLDDLFLNPKSFYAVVSMLFEDGKKLLHEKQPWI